MTDLDELLDTFKRGTLELPAERPEPVVARIALEDSPSETVRRHADTFRRWRPVVRERDGAPYVLATAESTAVAIALDDLGSARTKRVQLARAAEAHGWAVSAQRTTSAEARESIVLRFVREAGLPWERDRAVAYWSGPRLPFVAAYAWHESGRTVRVPRGWDPWAHTITPVPVSAAQLAEHLAESRAP